MKLVKLVLKPEHAEHSKQSGCLHCDSKILRITFSLTKQIDAWARLRLHFTGWRSRVVSHDNGCCFAWPRNSSVPWTFIKFLTFIFYPTWLILVYHLLCLLQSDYRLLANFTVCTTLNARPKDEMAERHLCIQNTSSTPSRFGSVLRLSQGVHVQAWEVECRRAKLNS